VNIIFKNHYMLIGKYIFIILFSFFVIRIFRGMGVRRGSKAAPGFWSLTFSHQFFCKKNCFHSFEWRKSNFATFAYPLQKYFGPHLENPTLAPAWKKKPSGAHVWGYILLNRNAEGVYGQNKFGKPWSRTWPLRIRASTAL